MPRTSMLSGLQDGQGLTPRMASPVVIRQSRQFSYERKVFRLVPCPHNCGSEVAKRTKRHDKLRHRFIVGRFVMKNKIIGAECHPDGFAFHSELLCYLARFVLPVRNFFDSLETLVSEVHQHDILWHWTCSPLKRCHAVAAPAVELNSASGWRRTGHRIAARAHERTAQPGCSSQALRRSRGVRGGRRPCRRQAGARCGYTCAT